MPTFWLQILKEKAAAARAAAASAGVASTSGTSSSVASNKRQHAAAAVPGQQLQPVGGDDDVQILSDMGLAGSARPVKQQKMTNFTWNKTMQQEFDLQWTRACIADGDSFNSSSSHSAKAKVIQQFFGATLPHRKKMAGPCLNAATEIAEKECDAALGRVNGFAVAFDGGKDKHIAGGSKLISVTGLLPNGKAVYLDTINTKDCYLDAET